MLKITVTLVYTPGIKPILAFKPVRIKQWLKITPALADPGDAAAASGFVLIFNELAQKNHLCF